METCGDGFEPFAKDFPREVEIGQRPLDAHKKQAEFIILMLVGMQDIGAVGVEKLGYGGDQSFAVGAIDEQDGSVSCVQMDSRL